MFKKTLRGIASAGLLCMAAVPVQAQEQVFDFSSSDFPSGDSATPMTEQYYGETGGYIEEEESAINFGGWLQGGWHSRDATAGAVDAPYTNRPLRFNTHAHRWNTHQAWMFVEKVADGSQGTDFGFRVDAMYGVDGADTQAFGNSPGRWDYQNGFDHGQFAFAIPQMYVEIASGPVSFKIGHFFTLVGYEVVPAPDNFFYSHAFTMYNSEPFTHWGILGTYDAGNGVTYYGGWTEGWDTAFDSFDSGGSFIGGASFQLSDATTATYIGTGGNFGARGEGYGHSIVLDTQLSDNLNYVIQGDYLDINDGGFGVGPLGFGPDTQYGINQYLLYTVNEDVAVGTRFEWWNASGVSVYDWTVGLNLRLLENMVARPEIRHDWAPGLGYDQTFLGMDIVTTF